MKKTKSRQKENAELGKSGIYGQSFS